MLKELTYRFENGNSVRATLAPEENFGNLPCLRLTLTDENPDTSIDAGLALVRFHGDVMEILNHAGFGDKEGRPICTLTSTPYHPDISSPTVLAGEITNKLAELGFRAAWPERTATPASRNR